MATGMRTPPYLPRGVMKQPPDANRRMFVQIFETAESGFGVNGQVFTPRGK